MRKIALALIALVALLSLPITAAAQPTLTLTGPGIPVPIKIGTTLTWALTLSGSAGANLSAIQFSLPFPNSNLTATIGAAGTAANKTLFCSNGNGSETCLLAGLNQTALADGVIATFAWVPTQSGTFTYAPGGVLGASNAAKALGVTVGGTGSITLVVASPCDINGDGKVDITDLQAFLNAFVFGMPAAGQVNPIGTGNTAEDAQRIATAGAPAGSAPGAGTCVTGP